MIRYNQIKLITAIIPFVFVLGCSDTAKNEQTAEDNPDKLIEISQEQFSVNDMQIAKPGKHDFESIVDCNGYIVASPNGMANISTQISGIVKRINVSAGDYVRKGQILCQLTSNEFISLQKDFAESSAKLKRLSLDYERSKELHKEKIESAKNFMAVESDYKVMQAMYKALKMQLQLLNLNTDKIEKNEFYLSYPVVAPISGQVSDIFINLGKYAQQQEDLMVVVDANLLQVKISVFEEDVNDLKAGQTVKFSTVNREGTVYTAVLKNIGKSINTETKTINCLAKIDKGQQAVFVNNSFVKVQIITDTQEAVSIPNEAIISSEDANYVLNLVKTENGNYFFEKVKVKTGRKTKQFTEILVGEGLTEILSKGVYNLQVE